MESNPLLAALQSNYGDGTPPPPDTSTVRGLLAFCRLWLDGETETNELNNPCMAMAARLKVGAQETENDLRQNPDMVQAARAPIERSAEAYWTIAEILDRLPGLAEDNDVEAFEDALELYDHERQVVLDCTAEIEERLSGETRLCPRCGAQGQSELCQACGLVRLFPDPRATQYDQTKTAILAPIYGQVNQAYDDVMSGKVSLPYIYESLAALEDQLLEFQKIYQQAAELEPDEEDKSPEFQDGKELATRLLKQVERSLEGIERMRSVQENFKMANLSRGWDTIFDAAVDISRATNRYARVHGHLEELGHEADDIHFSGN